MIITFLNETFLPHNPYNEEAYDSKRLTTHEILAVVSRYTSSFEDKSCNSFVQWCIRRNVNFLKAAVSRERKNGKNEKIGFRVLYVIKQNFIGKKLLIFEIRIKCLD